MANKYKRSSSGSRCLKFYPKPRYYMMAIAYCHNKLEYKAEFINKRIENFFDQMAIIDQDNLIKIFHQLEDKEKSVPHSIKNKS